MKKKFRSFSEAKRFVRKLDLKNLKEWRQYIKSGKIPNDIPHFPEGVYKNKGWKNLGDWLGTGYIHPRKIKYRTFVEARKFARNLKLESRPGWEKMIKTGNIPKNVPKAPWAFYRKKGWANWGDFLGTRNVSGKDIHKQFRSFKEARKFARKLRLVSQTDWKRVYCKSGKKPDDIPSNPQNTYNYTKEWTDWGDFLGTGRIANQDLVFLPWSKAKKEYQKLAQKYGLKNYTDWVRFGQKNKNKIPKNLPLSPWRIYTKERVWRKMK